MAVIICEHSYELTTDFIKGRKSLKRDENKIYLNPSQKEKALEKCASCEKERKQADVICVIVHL